MSASQSRSQSLAAASRRWLVFLSLLASAVAQAPAWPDSPGSPLAPSGGGGDDGPKIRFEFASNTTVRLGPGDFYIDPPLATTSPPPPHLAINFDNMAIIGAGPSTVLHFRNRERHGILVQNATNVTIQGFDIQYDPLPFFQGTIVGWDGDGDGAHPLASRPAPNPMDPPITGPGLEYFVEIDPALFPDASSAYFNTNTESRKATMTAHYPVPHVRAGSLKVRNEEASVQSVVFLTTPPGGPWTAKFVMKQKIDPDRYGIQDNDAFGYRVSGRIAPPDSSGFYALFATNATNVTYADVRVRSSPSVAFASNHCANLVYDNCDIEPLSLGSPASEAFFSSNRGGIRCFAASGGPTITECDIRRCGDDGIHLLSGWCEVVSLPAAGVIRVESQHSSFRPFWLDGLTAEVFDGTVSGGGPSLALKSDIVLGQSVSVGNDRYDIPFSLSSGTAPAVGDLIAAPALQCPGFIIADNRIGDNRARGILLKSVDGEVVDNVIDGSSFAGIVMGADADGEAGFCRDVVVHRNIVRNVGTSLMVARTRETQYGAITVHLGHTASVWPAARGNRDLTIEDNEVWNCGQCALFLGSASNVAVAGNVFVNAHLRVGPTDTMPYTDFGVLLPLSGTVQLQGCDGVTFTDNVWERSGSASPVVSDPTDVVNLTVASSNRECVGTAFEPSRTTAGLVEVWEGWPTSVTGYYNMHVQNWVFADPVVPACDAKFGYWGLHSKPTWFGTQPQTGLQCSRAQYSGSWIEFNAGAALTEVRFKATFNIAVPTTPTASLTVEAELPTGWAVLTPTLDNLDSVVGVNGQIIGPWKYAVPSGNNGKIRMTRSGPNNASPYVYLDEAALVF